VAFYRKILAERKGFEPPIGFPLYRFSKPARSTAPAPLRILDIAAIIAKKKIVSREKNLSPAIDLRAWLGFGRKLCFIQLLQMVFSGANKFGTFFDVYFLWFVSF
jgi:hypothetical protein